MLNPLKNLQRRQQQETRQSPNTKTFAHLNRQQQQQQQTRTTPTTPSRDTDCSSDNCSISGGRKYKKRRTYKKRNKKYRKSRKIRKSVYKR